MAKSGQLQNKYFYIDKWCANHVRKVLCCENCLHYEECLKKGESVAPTAIEHKYANSVIPKPKWEEDEDDIEEDDDNVNVVIIGIPK